MNKENEESNFASIDSPAITTVENMNTQYLVKRYFQLYDENQNIYLGFE